MVYAISPWMVSAELPLMAMPFGLDSYALTLDTYTAIQRSAGWMTPQRAPHLFENRFADQTPYYLSTQPGGYPTDLESRASTYIRTAVAAQWLPHWGRAATAYDAYTPAQHADITRGEQVVGVDGREKAIWELADSIKTWVDNDAKRADFEAAYQETQNKDIRLRLANLVQPGTTELTPELAQAIAQRLRPTEVPADKSPNAILGAYIQKLGGVSVVEAMLAETRNWVYTRGVTVAAGLDFRDKGFHRAEANALDAHLARKSDVDRRSFYNRLGEVKVESVDRERAKKEYDQRARQTVVRAMGAKSDEDVKALLAAFEREAFADFLKKSEAAIARKEIPVAQSTRRGRRGA